METLQLLLSNRHRYIGWVERLFAKPIFMRNTMDYVYVRLLNRFLWTVVAGLFNSTVYATEQAVLNMHIFEQQEPVLEQLAMNTDDNEQPALQMVIFSAEDNDNSDEGSGVDQMFSTADDFSFVYQLDAGYRNESLSWDVASPAGTPNPLLEVAWDDIALWRLQAGVEMTLPFGLLFKGRGSYGWTVNGSGTEVSYSADARQLPFSRIESNADNGYAWDFSMALGYPLTMQLADQSIRVTATPLAGYMWQKQQWALSAGRELIGHSNNALTKENNYLSQWQGPWLGMDLKMAVFDQHELFSSFEHHWASYQADADWQQASNLQTTQSFEHDTDTTGILASAGYRYMTANALGLSVSVDYARWESEAGNEQLFLSTGQQVNSVLNEVSRESFGLNLGVNFAF